MSDLQLRSRIVQRRQRNCVCGGGGGGGPLSTTKALTMSYICTHPIHFYLYLNPIHTHPTSLPITHLNLHHPPGTTPGVGHATIITTFCTIHPMFFSPPTGHYTQHICRLSCPHSCTGDAPAHQGPHTPYRSGKWSSCNRLVERTGEQTPGMPCPTDPKLTYPTG